MGIGVLWLLEEIAEHGSLRQAALEMNLSYPKALKMLRSIEQQVGRPVVERYKGGRSHGGAELTTFGRDFVRAYRGLCDRLQQVAAEECEQRLAPLLRQPVSSTSQEAE